MQFEIRQTIRITTTPKKLRAIADKMQVVWDTAKLGGSLEAYRELDFDGGFLVFLVDQAEMEKELPFILKPKPPQSEP